MVLLSVHGGTSAPAAASSLKKAAYIPSAAESP